MLLVWVVVQWVSRLVPILVRQDLVLLLVEHQLSVELLLSIRNLAKRRLAMLLVEEEAWETWLVVKRS